MDPERTVPDQDDWSQEDSSQGEWDRLRAAATEVAERAYAPYSRYRVGPRRVP